MNLGTFPQPQIKIIICQVDHNNCWIWTGTKNKTSGYAQMWFYKPKKHRKYVHRLVLEAKLRRPILPKMFACHTCDNPPCVNPDHLWEGTNSTNQRDMHKKGRANTPKGINHHNNLLSETDIIKIRKLVKSGLTQQEVANTFHIHQTHVGKIHRREIWKHL